MMLLSMVLPWELGVRGEVIVFQVTEACCSLTDAFVYVCYLPTDGGHRDDGQWLCVLHSERGSGEGPVEFSRQA